MLKNWITIRKAINDMSIYKVESPDVGIYMISHPGDEDDIPSTY